MNNVISLSGGKDSTAMLLMMLERNEPIHSVVFFDTGWEFPEMYVHLDLLEKNTSVKIWRLQSRLPFEYWMFHRPIKTRKIRREKIALLPQPKIEEFEDRHEYEDELGRWEIDPYEYKVIKVGEVYRTGNGWPSPSRRWCTREKVNTIKYFSKPIPNPVQCVGYAADETHRGNPRAKALYRFPLQEYNITEAQALQYCYDKGYNWGGLYNHFRRVSCFCCPLQRLGELRTLRKHFPELWNKMLEMDKANPKYNLGFRGYKTVHDLDKRFAKEDKRPYFNLK